ncbi:MAG: hypothetical protein K6A43_00125 [Treponema sp.]|nr:hypothetical protein [Treponema sp.]
MKTKLLKLLASVLFAVLLFTFTGCEQFLNYFDPSKQEINQLEIENSGLAVNKYIRGSIDGNECDITLYASNGTFSAEKTSRAAETSDTYEGYFVYNSESKTLYLRVSVQNFSYKKATEIDLSGTNGSDSDKPISVSFKASNKNDFTNAIKVVSELEPVGEEISESGESGEEGGTGEGQGGTGDNGREGEEEGTGGSSESGGSTENQGGTGTQEEPPAPPQGKTYSDYVDGIRYLNFGEKSDDEDVVFVSTIKPLPKPDYSAIDNAVKDLDIDSSKYSIEEAGKLIVETAGAKTIKEKARAIYAWICYHVDYDYSYSNYSAENAYFDRLAVCDGYSKLVDKMCKAVDVDSVQWVGLVVNHTTYGKAINKDQHAWNRICLDKNTQQYFLLDATWGSAGTLSTKKYMDDQWFDPDPCYFVTSHWSDEGGALISPSISRDDFMKLPILDPRLEQYFDGKELLEFCYKHNISDVVTLMNGWKGEIYKLPIAATLIKGKEYEIAYENEYSGGYQSKKISSDLNTTDENLTFSDSGLWLSYKLATKYSSEELSQNEQADVKFIYYDDQIELIQRENGIGVRDLGNWMVGFPDWPKEINGSVYFCSPDVPMASWASSAIFDPLYQEWTFIKGHYSSENNIWRSSDYDYIDFDDDPVTLIKQVVTKIDPRIDLSRTGDYLDRDYNEVYIPLSKKEEAENAVLNFDWTQDKEFSDFVHWMQSHNVPQDQIDFYIKMAKFPYQRGKTVSRNEGTRFAGPDWVYDATSNIVDDKGEPLYSGGMQKFFEFRKHEQRHLFNNETIPILMVHIKDSDGIVTEEPPADFFEHEAENIKYKLTNSGLKNNFEVYFAEIEMSYSEISSKLTPEDYMYIASWRQYSYLWDEALAIIKEKDPELAKKFEDKTKSAIIKYFDNDDLNGKIGNINGEHFVKSRLDNIMDNIGYSRVDHINIFGSEMKYHSPQCFNMNCVRDVAICPLCMYSFDID